MSTPNNAVVDVELVVVLRLVVEQSGDAAVEVVLLPSFDPLIFDFRLGGSALRLQGLQMRLFFLSRMIAIPQMRQLSGSATLDFLISQFRHNRGTRAFRKIGARHSLHLSLFKTLGLFEIIAS